MKLFFLNLALAILRIELRFENSTLHIGLPGYLARNERFVNGLAASFQKQGMKVRGF